MMSGFYGADTEQLREYSRLMSDRAASLEELHAKLNPLVMDDSAWRGSDGEAFRSTWSGDVSGTFRDVADRLRKRSEDLGNQADEQDRASESGGDSGGGEGSGHGKSSEEDSSSFWDNVWTGKDLYNKVQGAFSKGKKAWDLLEIANRFRKGIDAVDDPLLELMGTIPYGAEVSDKVFSGAKEYGTLAQKIAGHFGVPTGIGTKNFFGWADKLASKAGFLTKAAPFVGKALPGIDVVTGGWQMIDSINKGDTFHAVTGGASALGGGLMLAGGALSATGVGAVVGGPLAAAGAVISGGAAVADLGKFVYDEWGDDIAAGAGKAWDAVSDTTSHVVDAVGDTASDVGGAIADGVSGAWHGVFG
jgi:hypothetical protein